MPISAGLNNLEKINIPKIWHNILTICDMLTHFTLFIRLMLTYIKMIKNRKHMLNNLFEMLLNFLN